MEIILGKSYLVRSVDTEDEIVTFNFIPEYSLGPDHKLYPNAYWGRDEYGIRGIVTAEEFLEETK